MKEKQRERKERKSKRESKRERGGSIISMLHLIIVLQYFYFRIKGTVYMNTTEQIIRLDKRVHLSLPARVLISIAIAYLKSSYRGSQWSRFLLKRSNSFTIYVVREHV